MQITVNDATMVASDNTSLRYMYLLCFRCWLSANLNIPRRHSGEGRHDAEGV